MKRAFVLGALAACSGDVDEPWQLDHDRVIAVRASPPRIVATARAEIDGLIGRVGESPATAPPAQASVISPAQLVDTLSLEGQRWIVTAPEEARLASVRGELGLADGAPVPLVVAATFEVSGAPLVATKTVWLGDTADNPSLVATIDNAPATPEIVIARAVDVPLSVPFAETDDVNWLTSCGTMHDYDLARAYVHVEGDDQTSGDLAVVVRTPHGGVAWQVWAIRAE